jgi:osmotically-inducible protein OsmY
MNQITISKRTAAALTNNMQQINMLNAVAQGARQTAQAAVDVANKAQEQVQSASAAHQEHVAALIEDAGEKLEDYQKYNVVEDGGEYYLRATVENK